ncbi:MAG: hypothetical protein O2887_19250 [Bacteroidetes bacterium]|nr:hypothetical protein [Bacteroidota bacterium]MDA1122590.1 hypothetical protein [Bacteroidota bacterium]
MSIGRFEEALIDAELGVTVNPLYSFNWASEFFSLYFNNQKEKALQAIEESLKLFQDEFITTDACRVYLYTGLNEKVVEINQLYLKDNKTPRSMGTVATAFYHLGKSDRANELLNEIKAQSKESPSGSPAFYVAMVYAQMGETDLAFKWLDKAYEDHEVEMYWLKVEPPFEPLRSDPRWQVMLDKVGFPK